MLRDSASEKDHVDFIREALTQSRLNHVNLVNLVGVCVVQQPWLVVLEYLPYGDLRNVVEVVCRMSKISGHDNIIGTCLLINRYSHFA